VMPEAFLWAGSEAGGKGREIGGALGERMTNEGEE
jgi:hypothetical protein